MQEKSDNHLLFSSRVNHLRSHLGDLSRVAEQMGISRQTLTVSCNGKEPISGKTWEKLRGLEDRLRVSMMSESDVLEEPRSTYGVQAMAEHRMKLNPAYASPPSAPTREQIEARVKEYLDAAERVPGGLGYAWGQIAVHLNPQSLDALKIET